MIKNNTRTHSETLTHLWGRVSIEKQFSDGKTVLHFENDNLIVTTAKNIVLSQLYYAFGSGDPLSHAKVGIGGASDLAGSILKTPSVSMTDLYTPQLSVPMAKTSEDMNIPKIVLIAQIGESQCNGLKINEAGFFTTSGKMFNIKTFPYILKDSSFAINLRWEIGM